jgi:hypothetical protein
MSEHLTLTVTEFVLARLGEDEANLPDETADLHHETWWRWERYRDQCAAMRKIVEEHPMTTAEVLPREDGAHSERYGWAVLDVCETCTSWGQEEHHYERYPCPTIRAVASIWSDHPQFDPDWSAP